MAEATIDQRPRFFCHQCSTEISPNLPDYTCPRCESGFIEEIEDNVEEQSLDPFAEAARVWSQQLMESFRAAHVPIDDEELSSDSEMETTEDSGPASRTRSRQQTQHMFNPFQNPRSRIQTDARRANPHGFHAESFIQQILTGLTGGGVLGVRGGLPFTFSLGGLYGNPGDYAWGNTGLDTIITQLLNQLDSSGPPPAPKDQIESLPTVNITQIQVDKNMQCSVCMEDFKLDESVRKLPCNHHFHNDCIVPWLELHGTCPVCRKTLDGKDTSTDEAPTPSVSEGAGTQEGSGSHSNTESTPSSQSSSLSRRRSNNYDNLEEYD